MSTIQNRRKLFAGLCASLLGLCAAGYFFSLADGSAVLRAETGSARIVRLLGRARIKSADQQNWRPAQVGLAVRDGDLLETGPQSGIIVQYGATQIRLGARTRTRVDALLDRARQSRIHLERGFAWFRVNGKEQRHGFKVSTPTAVASVRGTKFSLTETEQGALSCVCEGVVEMRPVTGRNDSDAVSAGASYTYNEDGTRLAKDFTPYFRGLKADRSFQSQILNDSRLNYCKTCHRMTNLATDSSPDPRNY